MKTHFLMRSPLSLAGSGQSQGMLKVRGKGLNRLSTRRLYDAEGQRLASRPADVSDAHQQCASKPAEERNGVIEWLTLPH